MVSALSMVFMAISAILSIGLPIALFLLFRKKYRLHVIPMAAGAIAFVVFALILEQFVHALVLRPDASGAIEMKNTPWLYMLYGGFAAGIFEETARFIVFKILKKKFSGIGTALSYGIGHGGIEAVLLAGAAMIINLVFCLMINSGTVPLDQPGMAEQVTALVEAPAWMFLISGLERVMAVTIQISLSVLVFYAATQSRKWWLYPVAVVLHAVIDFPAALMQAGAMQDVLLVEGIVLVCTLAVAAIAVLVHKKCKTREALAGNVG